MIDIETDKVVLELPAPAAGVIVQIIKDNGATVVAGEVIAIIDTEGTAKVSPLEVSAIPAPALAAAAQETSTASAPAAAATKGDVAMPAAAKILSEKGLAAGDVAGSGKDGRVTKGDALAACRQASRRRACASRRQAGPAASCRAWPPPAWATVRKSACR